MLIYVHLFSVVVCYAIVYRTDFKCDILNAYVLSLLVFLGVSICFTRHVSTAITTQVENLLK